MSAKEKPLKIGITCYPTYGGSGVLATELGKQLARHGHEIHFISYALPYRLKGFISNVYFHEVQVSNYPLFEHQPYTLNLAVKMHEVIRETGLDLLHVHYAIPHATSAWIAKQMLGQEHPIKLITTLHGTDITLVGQEASFKEITRFSIERSDGVTAVSEYLRGQTLDFFNIANHIEVIPNFVNTEEFSRHKEGECCRKHLAPCGEKVIMHISNMRPVKRLGDVVKVFAKVAEKIKCRLVLVGDGPETATVSRLAGELGVSDRILLLGAQDSIASLLNCADIVLQPSATESFGLVILEAMSMGVPAVSTRCGGPEEVVEHGACGFLSDIGDVDDMAANCLRLLTDKELYDSFSRHARERVLENYEIETITRRYEAFYRKILG
ncbi:N-acetyl-alpha-D-glucosaminyl L-malate synthase BshA [bacterium]|nr:N-acetyl-alpha-D-glucosaminyl L-malate synthase BshA [bacterium]